MVGGEARMGGGARMVVGRGQGLMMAGVWGSHADIGYVEGSPCDLTGPAGERQRGAPSLLPGVPSKQEQAGICSQAF